MKDHFFYPFLSSGVHFNSQAIAPTIEQIDQSFGATHPGGELTFLAMCMCRYLTPVSLETAKLAEVFIGG